MQTSSGARQAKECLSSLYSSFSPPSLLVLPFSQNNSSFVLPSTRCIFMEALPPGAFGWVYFCLVWSDTLRPMFDMQDTFHPRCTLVGSTNEKHADVKSSQTTCLVELSILHI